MITPTKFLPPPWYFKIWVRCLISTGKFTGKGYWFWNIADDTLYWNKKQNEIFGLAGEFSIGTYESLFSSALWDDDDREHVKKTIDLAREHRAIFRHQFCIRHAKTGEKIIVDSKGRWIFDEETGEPWAMWGWNQKMPLSDDAFAAKEAAIKLRQRVNKWKENGLPTDISETVAACYHYAKPR